MDLATLSTKKVDEVKDFLRLRGLKISGKTEELAARVFFAMENDLPVLKAVEEVQADIAKEYGRKFCMNGGDMIPDPLKLDHGTYLISYIFILLNLQAMTFVIINNQKLIVTFHRDG